MHNIICNAMFFFCPKLEQTENNILCTGMMFKNYLSGVGADYFVFFSIAASLAYLITG